MAFWKTLGKGIGEVTGGVIGGAVGIVGEVTNNKFISEVGAGIYNSSKFMGEQLGNATQGVWDVGEGFIKKDDAKIDEGFSNIGEGVSKTGSAVLGTAKHVAKSAGDIGGGLLDDDPNRWKRGARELGKTAAIGVLGVSILDFTGVVDVNGNENSVNTDIKIAEDSSTIEVTENPNTHHVDAHYVEGHFRGDLWIDGYWRDGDGDTSTDTYNGYESSNPDYRTKI